jgi:16S rRNA processing protein RimM
LPSGPQDWVWLARILRPQGRKGEVFASILTDFPEKFDERKQLWLLSSSSAKSGFVSEPAKSSFVSGHDFSRAAKTANMTWALAPAELSKGKNSQGATVKGTGFSPYINPAKKGGALAPEAIKTPREVELVHHWLHKGGIVLHFAGIDSITAAETLKGLTVAIPRTARAPLAEDEVYVGDLIGCALFDVAPAAPLLVGEIEDVDRSAGPVALLVVNGASGEVLIPFAKSYLRKIDLQANRVEMALPEGLVELNQ